MTAFDADREWERWRSWLGEGADESSIGQDIVGLLASRQLWETWQLVVKAAPAEAKRNGTFSSWVADGYVKAMAMGIRRQVDANESSISMARLLQQILKHPEVLDADRYAASITWATDERARAEFAESVPHLKEGHVDPGAVERELEEIQDAARPIERWATKTLAHYDRGRDRFIAEGPTFEDLHHALDVISAAYVRWRSRIRGAHMSRHVSMSAWPSVFLVPWIGGEDVLRSIWRAGEDLSKARSDVRVRP